MKISPFDWEEERMLNALLASWRSALYQQSNRKWSVRPKLLSLFLPKFSTQISFPWKSRFLSFVASDFLQPGIPSCHWGLMRTRKIKCCKLGLSRSLIWTSERNFMFNSKFGDFSPVSCHLATTTPLTAAAADIHCRSPKSQTLDIFLLVSFYDNPRGFIISISPQLCFHKTWFWIDLMDPAVLSVKI